MAIETQCYEKKLVRRDDAQTNPKSEIRNPKSLAHPLAISVFQFRTSDFATTRYLAVKSVLEFVGATFLLVLTSPLILLAAVLVKLTSSGPGIYSQVRLGLFGKPYRIYKIRTMAHECERQSGVRWSTQHDSRVTPLGRLLRRTHLDELPQLWNVIRGDMSLIGPRPERPELIPALQRAIPHYSDRLLVRPGVTGLAQVQLPADTDMESVRRKLAYDLYYVRQVSFWLDLRILCCTAFKVAGVPYYLLRGLFRMPSRFRVERAYRKLGVAAETPATETSAQLLMA
jgi:lipopolysaccharide/colanic/teichoic acid biosynthesis glycosyltransferase